MSRAPKRGFKQAKCRREMCQHFRDGHSELDIHVGKSWVPNRDLPRDLSSETSNSKTQNELDRARTLKGLELHLRLKSDSHLGPVSFIPFPALLP